MPAPRKPDSSGKLGEDLLPQPQDDLNYVMLDDEDGQPSQASAKCEGFGVASLVSRRSFYSENLPDKALKAATTFPPNRILHDRQAARIESMLQDVF